MSALLRDPLLRLRPMVLDDVPDVMGVERLAYEHPWTTGIMQDCLRVGYCCWVMVLDQRLIGHGVMSVAVGEAHVLNICVHPEMQGRGLGRKLMERLLRLAREHHADTAFLEVRESNLAAQGLYLSMGFNEVGQRRAYYPADHGREDALVYAKSLD